MLGAGDNWKGYFESISGTNCPLSSSELYAAYHNPFVYFDDVTSDAGFCRSRLRPYAELEADLSSNTAARYNFIVPNLCNDMHNVNDARCASTDRITTGDLAVIDTTGGVNNSGVLKLTKAINSQSGSLIIEDLDGGNTVYGFDMTFKLRLGGGTPNTPADGFSVDFAPDLPDGAFGEDGAGSGIRIGFDIYNNGASENPPAPSIDVRIGAGGRLWLLER